MKAFNSLLHLLGQLLKVQEDQLAALLKLEPLASPVLGEEVWLHTEQVMEIFKKSRKTIYNWRKTGQLRFKVNGGTCYYLKADIYCIVKK